MRAKIYLLKTNKIKQWREWCNVLATKRHLEAQKTLQEEGGTFEAFGIFAIDGVWYTIGIDNATKKGDEHREINQEHRLQKQECFASSIPVEIGYSIDLHTKNL